MYNSIKKFFRGGTFLKQWLIITAIFTGVVLFILGFACIITLIIYGEVQGDLIPMTTFFPLGTLALCMLFFISPTLRVPFKYRFSRVFVSADGIEIKFAGRCYKKLLWGQINNVRLGSGFFRDDKIEMSLCSYDAAGNDRALEKNSNHISFFIDNKVKNILLEFCANDNILEEIKNFPATKRELKAYQDQIINERRGK